MRGWLVLTVLALAGCNEHEGWNPNHLGDLQPPMASSAREAGLTGQGSAPATIPTRARSTHRSR